MAKIVGKILSAFLMVSVASVVSPAAALPLGLLEDQPSEETEDGGLENIVDDVSDTVVDPAASAVGETGRELLDEAGEVEDAADEVVPGDVELVDKLEETAEPVTSGEAVDELTDDGGELVGEVEEEVYSVPVVGEAAEDVTDTAEPVVDELTDTAEPVVDSILPRDEDDSEDGSSTDEDHEAEASSMDEEETASDVISKEESAEDFAMEQSDNTEQDADNFVPDTTYERSVVPNPDLSEDEKQEIVEEVLDVPGLKEWSSDGWRYVSMDFVGEEESGEVVWEDAIVYLHLPDGEGSPPEECSQGWSAAIRISLETKEAEDSGYPTESSSDCESMVVLEDPGIGEKMLDAFTSVFSPEAKVKPSFVIAEADDVVANDVYGNAAHIKTPAYDGAIFDHMDRYVAHLLNQKWNTAPAEHMAQVGWLITAIGGCADCGDGRIEQDAAAIVFTDTSVFGNLEARRIPFEWKAGESLVSETVCNEESNYLISVAYAGEVFNHNTRVSCDSADNDSKTSNSVFFENWNTVDSASWAKDITGAVEANSAYGFMNSRDNLDQWSSSTNEEQKCDSGTEPTDIISNGLSTGETATWSGLDRVPTAC